MLVRFVVPAMLSFILARSAVAQVGGGRGDARPSDAPPSAAAAPSDAAAPLRLRIDPQLSESNTRVTEGRPSYASGQHMEGRQDRETTLTGDAEVRRAGMVIRGDRLTYYPEDDELVAVGNVRVARPGSVFAGPELQLKLDANEGYFDSPSYALTAVNGHGRARRVDFIGPNEAELTQATYTTCRADDPAWYIRADSIELDERSQEGSGVNGNLVSGGRNWLWAPRFWFPMDDSRKSGFLAPMFSLNSRWGAALTVPYYFNIAPNRDLTVYSRASTRRGLQFGGNFRYLEPNAFGNTQFEYNPRDLETHQSRYFYNTSNMFSNLFGGWTGGAILRGVSDDNYFVDYATSMLGSSEQALPRDVWASRGFGDWVVTLRGTRYQNILDSRLAPPYERVPQMLANYSRRDWHGADVTAMVDVGNWQRPLVASPEGVRAVFNPSISLPWVRPGGFLTPKISMNMASYKLHENLGLPESLNRAVPTFSLDGGLIFERDNASFFGRDAIQTLEPRLYYARTPYRNQDAMPLFDTSIADFNFSQLFSPNTFIGNDRIADVNQLTAAVVSRYISPDSGSEFLRLAFGQRYYFSQQRVSIPGVNNPTDRRSDVLLAASGNLTPNLSFDSGMQYSLSDGSVPRANMGVRYNDGKGTMLNVGLRYLVSSFGQLDTSWRYPINGRWNTLGRINYSFLKKGIDPILLTPVGPGLVEGVLGVEYTEDCWILRLVLHKFTTAQSTTTTALFVQLELTGLGRIGSSPFDILRRNIPGYQIPGTLRSPAPSAYFGYE